MSEWAGVAYTGGLDTDVLRCRNKHSRWAGERTKIRILRPKNEKKFSGEGALTVTGKDKWRRLQAVNLEMGLISKRKKTTNYTVTRIPVHCDHIAVFCGWMTHPTAKVLKKWTGSAVLAAQRYNFQPLHRPWAPQCTELQMDRQTDDSVDRA